MKRDEEHELQPTSASREKRSSHSASLVKSTPTEKDEKEPATAGKDPHTLEREARDRERMRKEQQRREAMKSDCASGGRRRDSKHDRAGGGGLASGRRVSYRYEDEVNDQMRIEQEREASRWA